MSKSNFLTCLGSALLLTVVSAASSLAADKVPETPAEHQQTATDYGNKAKEHRAESQMHHRMAEMYGARIKGPTNQKPNPWLINMVSHCKKAAAKAADLAVEEEALAKAHAERVKNGP